MKNKKLKCGSKAKIVNDNAGHGLPMGTVVTLGRKQNQYYYIAEHGVNVMLNDIAPVALTKEEIEAEVERLKGEIAIEEAKLAYMKKTKSKLFDETEFKVWAALQELKTKRSDIDKARLIAKIINGE
jgi:hypothetical protein